MAGLRMSEAQFSKFMEETGERVVAEEAKPAGGSGGGEVEVRLTLWRDRRMRWGHIALIVWAVFTIMGGSWHSIPLIALWLIAIWDVHRTWTGIEELLAGLNAAGIISTETTETARSARAQDGRSLAENIRIALTGRDTKGP